MTPNETLLKAADYIAHNGHCKGQLWELDEETGKMAACAIGALAAVTSVRGERRDARRLLRAELNFESADLSGAIPLWNDDPSTTAEDVILTMKRAASREAE